MNPYASLIVLSYNNLKETTKPCLESILKNTPLGSYELVVVDNASTDGTQEYLQSFAEAHDHVRVQLNKENRGYAGGNNDGLRLACGKHLILLNNDTLVPAKWLGRLLHLLETNLNVGLVGPVTNSAGNEQRIELPNLTEKNFAKVAECYTTRHQGVWFTTEKLGFFCVAMRREIFEKVGYLDEGFGIGMFEDDDYCLRVRKAGYALAVAEDCFIYHKGSMSFSQLSYDFYQDLFRKNKSYLYKKHKIQWTFSELAFSYWNKFNNDFTAYTLSVNKVDPNIERILVRFENFKHLLVQIHSAEMKNQQNISHNPIIAQTQWAVRWKVFKDEFVGGSIDQKLNYIRALMKYLFNRKSNIEPIDYSSVIEKLATIRKESKFEKAIVIPATVDFHFLTQRPQNLAIAFARHGYLVIYGTLNHSCDNVEFYEKIEDNVYLVNEKWFPLLFHVITLEETIYYCMWPNNRKHLKHLSCATVIYDYMDDLALLDLPPEQVKSDHSAMLERADAITVSARRLMDQLPSSVRHKAALVPNAVSETFLAAVEKSTPPPAELQQVDGRPIIGYYGAIAEWMDYDLIETMATSLAKTRIILIGPTSPQVADRIAALTQDCPNIQILPPRPQNELIPYLQRFNVCIIPFLKNAITDAVSPVKLYEYFSAGRPVVTTNLEECQHIRQVRTAKNTEEFICAVQELLTPPSTEFSAHTILYARNNTWQLRVRQIQSLLSLGAAGRNNIDLEAVQREIAQALAIDRPDFQPFYAEQYAMQESFYWTPVLDWIDALSPSIDTVLDIGAAYGTLMLYVIKKHEPKIRAVYDKVPFFPPSLARKYNIINFPLDIERDLAPENRRYDLILFTEVIEHLNFHPLPTLQKLRDMLTPKGSILLTTPDAYAWGRVEKYYTCLDSIPLYNGQLSEWIDDHIWQYEKDELDELFAEAGLFIKDFAYAPGINGRHLCYWLSR